MPFWDFIFRSVRKSKRLREISLALGDAQEFDPAAFLDRADRHERALADLWKLVEGDAELARVVVAAAADRAILNDAYGWLLKAGAGQWCRGHWVAASAFVFTHTLSLVLTGMETRNKDQWLAVAFRLVEYFDKGEVGRIK